MSSEKAPRLLTIAWKYQIKFSEMVNILEKYGFNMNDLRPTSFASPEIIEAIEQHIKKQKNDYKLNEYVKSQNKEISDGDTSELDNIYKPKIDSLSGLKIKGKIELPINEGIEDNKRKRKRIPDKAKNRYSSKETKENLGWAIGVLNFFDYNKNDFGIIEKIITEKNKIIEKARVFGDGLKTNRRLIKGDIVFFQLSYSENYFHKYLASSVDIIDNISIENLVALFDVIDEKQLAQILINYSDSEFEKIRENDRVIILDKIITVLDQNIWKLVLRMNSTEYIKKYVSETINSYSDEIKLNYLWDSKNEILYNNIIQNWNSTNSGSLTSLLNYISNNKIEIIHKPSSLIISIHNSDLNYNGILEFTKILKTDDFRKKLIKNFSFTSNTSISDLLFLNDLFKLEIYEIDEIKETLKVESSSLSFSKLYSIYKELKVFNIIPTYDDLISLLQDKQLAVYELIEFIKLIPKGYISSDICCIIKKSINSIDKWKYDEILDIVNLQSKIGKYIVDLIINKEGSFDSWKLLRIIKTKSNSKAVNKYFLDRYSHELSEDNLFETLELGINNDSTKAQEAAYKKITDSKKYDISSEHDLRLILEQLEKLEIPVRVKELNKPFSEFINYLQKTNDFDIKNDLRKFLNEYSGATQTLIVKYLIYQFYKKRLSNNKLVEVLNSFIWTEISALIIVEFIKEKNYSDKILAEKLDVILKNHFLTISNGRYNSNNFLNHFQIKNIINKCNGRKQYDGNNWQNRRWYFQNGNATFTVNKYQDFSLDFFCEGRPWKFQEVWDSNTGRPTGKKIELFWCKTRYCASRNDSFDTSMPYYSWTISEISYVMGITIEKLALSHLAGWANRMNQIIRHLFCRECNEVLRPIPFVPHTLGYYAVPIFNCLNPKCSEYEKRIRFTHCMNGKCESHLSNEPLDSRDCESCNKSDIRHTGLLCKHCGQPCPKCSGGYHPIYAEDRF